MSSYFCPSWAYIPIFWKNPSIPNVLASSGIIGTNLGEIFLSLNKLVNILTSAIVVDISFSPVETFIKSKISFDGALIGFAKVDLSGK